MSTMTAHYIKCGNCENKHPSVQSVKDCYSVAQPIAAVEERPLHLTPAGNGVTVKQLEYINDLGGNCMQARTYTAKGASHYIERLKKEKRTAAVSNPQTDAPNRSQTYIPLDYLHKVEDGYYASRMDSTRPFTFFRFSRPKPNARTQFAGALKIQTQHGPDLSLAMVIWPNGKLTFYNKAVEDALLLVTTDPNGCAIAYAEELGHCMRCNTELTDERSRWFGIGPDCEKVWPHIIAMVEDMKGPFKHGWENAV